MKVESRTVGKSIDELGLEPTSSSGALRPPGLRLPLSLLLLVTAWSTLNADIKTLRSDRDNGGRMIVRSDEFGTFGSCSGPQTLFDYDSNGGGSN